jgi:hypothetical protein
VIALAVALVIAAVTPVARAAELSVTDHGVGRGVADRELQEKASRFDEGAKVWFWTRVVGGGAGDRIRHVWMQDGEERLTVELTVGGPTWRTWSHKTLHRGSRGSWTVEVRDDSGRVLARETFECASPEPVRPEDGQPEP